MCRFISIFPAFFLAGMGFLAGCGGSGGGDDDPAPGAFDAVDAEARATYESLGLAGDGSIPGCHRRSDAGGEPGRALWPHRVAGVRHPSHWLHRVSSPGLYGFTPWLDREHGYYAILAMENRDLSQRGTATDLEQRLKPLIVEALQQI